MEDYNTNRTSVIEGGTPLDGAQFYSIIVFCHLRWDFVYQRPQHLMSRMAADRKLLFVEEPIGYEPHEENTANLIRVSEHIDVLQPRVKDIHAIGAILKDFMKNKSIPVGWFYSAAFTPVLEALTFEAVVYDCMDELALFKGAPQSLIDQEKYLISIADVVFTGGKSLYDSKKALHENTWCFPSSVDEKHFAAAKGDIPIPADIAGIPGIVVGYFGVIDERIDLELINTTAAMLPDISFVMVGPLAKITQDDLPRRANIHYLGMKSYNELPNYVKAFDIAMMPFALNDATKYISPTKTLEYMAASKPIISTMIKDVVTDYSDVVELIANPFDFREAIETILQQDDELIADQYKEILANTSWDATAEKMKIEINKINVL